MTKTYKMATKKQQVAKDIARAAKFLGLGLFFRCNKQLHRVEFMLDASPREMQKMADLIQVSWINFTQSKKGFI